MTVPVDARRRWNPTGVMVSKGETYRFEVRPPDQTWKDWWKPASAAGFSLWYLKPFEPFRRVSSAPWCALVGAVGQRPETTFVVGLGVTHTVTADGELTAFANDMSVMYWNNHGSITLTITRV